jgi:type IV pilus assembly protein PilN
MRINLLPHREMRREQRKREFFGNLVATTMVGGVLVFAGGFAIDRQIEAQAARNAFVGEAIKKQDLEIGEIRNLEGAIASLRARQQAVEDLQRDRMVPVHLFDELFKLMPPGVVLVKLQQVDLAVTLSGFAQSNERVAELLRKLSERSEWFGKPQLEEIKEVPLREGSARDQGTPSQAGRQEPRRAYEFKLNVLIRRRDAQGEGKPEALPAANAGAATSRPATVVRLLAGAP